MSGFRGVCLAASLALWMATAPHALATAQFPEELIVGGKTEVLFSEPLNSAIDSNPTLSKFLRELPGGTCTALWRGYRGTWEIKDDELYLVRVQVDVCSGRPREVPLATLFPGTAGPVKAAWYSGVLRVPQGRMVEYVHMGYASRFERYLHVHVERGKVVRAEDSQGKLPLRDAQQRPSDAFGRSCNCIQVYAPVVCRGGAVFSNACVAACAGARDCRERDGRRPGEPPRDKR